MLFNRKLDGSRHAANPPRWSSRLLFILSAMGCTIGLGNIWRFPLVAGENGGGVFLFVYLIAMLCLSIPLMIAELYIGRTGQGGPAKAISKVARLNGADGRWSALGHFMAVIGVVILCYYPIVGSWTLEYIIQAAAGDLANRSAQENTDAFGGLMSDTARLAFLHTVFLPLAAIVTALGVQRGVETLNKYAIPLLLIILAFMLVYGVFTFGLTSGLTFLFQANMSLVTPAIILAAAGQALFSTAVGQGVLLTFASYLDSSASVVRYSAIICLFDGLIAIIFGIFIFSVVGHYGLAPDSGTGLAYVTLPLGFAQMPYGNFIATAFFVALFIAAFTSTVPSVDFVARWLSDHTSLSHRRAALVVGAGAWCAGLVVILSLDQGSYVGEISDAAFGRDLLRAIDYLAGNIAIPVSALLLAFFIGWRVKSGAMTTGVDWPNTTVFAIWRWTVRIVAPALLAAVLLLNF